ncbi:hypothetical protein [uncultured Winogradskyella sp.]|uniref:hypothetical protein n=1 Tax=uncultured Winogradskyella sp. TaxID=395353 RepID=UPI0026212E81|nr:hypothetical protein [uncultured Winogradskyella sp.]
MKNKILSLVTFFFSISNLFSQNNDSIYNWKYNTITHELLETEKHFSDLPDELYDKMFIRLDSIIDKASISISPILRDTTLTKKDKALNILKSISLTIEHFNFSLYIPTKNLTTMFLTNRVDCDTGAMLYIAIAEVNKLPLYLVEVPDHNFVRYYYDEANYFNWDNNTSMEVTDSEYKNGMSQTSSSLFTIDDAVLFRYLQPMSIGSVKAYYYSLIDGKKNIPKMKKLYEFAIKESPHNPLIMNNYSWFILTNKEYEGSIADNKLALELSLKVDELMPQDSNYKDTLGCAYAANENFKKAIEIETKYGGNDFKQVNGYMMKKKCVNLNL